MSTQDDKERLELLQGTPDLLILRTLIFSAQHGQGIARAIQQTSEEELLVEHGALLSGAATAGGAGLDFREVGNLFEQPQSAVLFADFRWPQAIAEGNDEVEAAGGGDWTDP